MRRRRRLLPANPRFGVWHVGIFVIATAAIAVGATLAVERVTADQSPTFSTVAARAECLANPQVGYNVYQYCTLYATVRNKGADGSAVATLRVEGDGYNAQGNRARLDAQCVTAIPRTRTGDAAEISCGTDLSGHERWIGIPGVVSMVIVK